MPSFGSETGNVLYLIVCGAPPAADTPQLVKEKQAEGWQVCVVATPHGARWLNTDELEKLTGHPVRVDFRHPNDDSFDPLGDAVLVSPATFNTINKWALGINDTLALGLLNEAIGSNVPVEARPEVNQALASHPAYRSSTALLASLGVHFLTEWSEPESDNR
jgi:phosphopantothenoylcysteine synthetase/decarboxylase